MLRIFHDTTYDFIKPWRIMVAATVVFIVIGISSLIFTGIRYSIDFTGGTLIQLRFVAPPDVGRVRSALDRGGVHDAEIQAFGSNREFTVRAQNATKGNAQTGGADSVAQQVSTILDKEFGPTAYRVVRTEAVGPRVGSELRRNALVAILISFGVTLLYLAIRFEWRFGVAADLATAHDILTTLAFIKLMNIEVSLTVVAAILTVIGYSMNDTIIIFDRVRENLRRRRREPLYDTLNRSVNETLPRSVMTHATALAATLALLLFAGEVIRPFAWVMAFGIVTGTFSSIYVAAPVLLWIERRWPRDAEQRATAKAGSQRTPAASEPAGRAAKGTAPGASKGSVSVR
ncbi:MAG TPA: protein translocase subunit SecF [Gemmatimonadaceae bacterium]|nr:protein translocase subunit SecF [Gemmatimonadaceae bacterium]